MINIGIDATSVDQGGGLTYLKNLLNYTSEVDKLNKVIIFINKEISKQIPFNEKLIIITLPCILFKKSFLKYFFRFFWMFVFSKKICEIYKIELLYCLGGYTFSRFNKYVIVLRNFLIYDLEQQKLYGYTFQRLRLVLLNYLEKKAIRYAFGIICLSTHSYEKIYKYAKTGNICIINHGVNNFFYKINIQQILECKSNKNVVLTYTSRFEPYKHQLELLFAINQLTLNNINIELNYIGFENNKYGNRVYKKYLEIVNNNKINVNFYKFSDNNTLGEIYKQTDIFLFLSTCETFPHSLIEAAASGLPIICSFNRPMSDIMGKNAVYVDPNSVESIMNGLLKLINNKDEILKYSKLSKSIALNFNNSNSAKNTFDFLLSLK